MKKSFLPILLALLLLLAGCSGGKANDSAAARPDSTKTVKEYMESHVMADAAPMLEGEWLTVTPGGDGKVNITIRAFAPYLILTQRRRLSRQRRRR